MENSRANLYIVPNGNSPPDRKAFLHSPKKKRAPLPPSFRTGSDTGLTDINLSLFLNKSDLNDTNCGTDRQTSAPSKEISTNRKTLVTDDVKIYRRSHSTSDLEVVSPQWTPRQRAYAFCASDTSEQRDDESSMTHRTPETSDWLVKPVKLWTIEDVQYWCFSVGLMEIARQLLECGIDGKGLFNFLDNSEGCKEIKDTDTRKKFLQEFSELKNRPETYDPTHKQEPQKRRRLPKLDFSKIHARNNPKEKQNVENQGQCTVSSSKELKTEQTNNNYLLNTTHETNSLCRGRGNSDSTLELIQYNIGVDSTENLKQNRFYSDNNVLVWHKKDISQWKNEDVLHWLNSVSLNKYVLVFKAKNVTGKELKNIDANLLDALNIHDATDREEILSKCFNLVNSYNKSIMSCLRSQSDPTLIKTVTVERSCCTEEHLQTSSNSSSPRTPVLSKGATINRNSSDKKRKGGFSKLKQVISPKIFGTRNKEIKENDCVQIWNNLTKQDSLSTMSVKVKESTSCTEIIHTLLDQHEITDDSNLYCLVECPTDPEQEILDREMGKYECPLFVQRQWSNLTHYRFELHKSRGRQIKVVCRVSSMKQHGKSFSISYSSTCIEVLSTALKKIHLKNVDPALFCLMEVDKVKGDIRLLESCEIIVDLPTDCFVLCDRANIDSLYEDDSTISLQNAQASVVRRNSSLLSHGSSISGTSLRSSNSFVSSGSDNLKPRIEKLESLETEMADIETSITGLQDPQADAVLSLQQQPADDGKDDGLINSDVEHSDLDTSEETVDTNKLQIQLEEKDRHISFLQAKHQNLLSKSSELENYQSQLADLESSFKKKECEWQCMLNSLKTELTAVQLQTTNVEVLNLKMEVENTRCELEAKSKVLEKIRKETKAGTKNNSKNCSPSIEYAEKEFQLSFHESSLVSLKKTLSSLLKKLDEAVQKQKKFPEGLSCMLCENLQNTLYTKNVPNGAEIIVSTGKHNEVVIAAANELTGLLPGDRILEIGNKNALGLSEKEISAILQTKQPVKLLILRNEQITDPVTEDAIDSMKEDLSLAIMELESAQHDNQDLIEDSKKLVDRNAKLEKECTVIKQQNGTLKSKVKVLEDRWKDLRKTLVEMKSSDAETCKLIENSKLLHDNMSHIKMKDYELVQMKTVLAQNATHITRLQEDIRSKDFTITELSAEKEEALARLEMLQPEHPHAVPYEDLDTHVPLWVSLRDASKDNVLQALKDNIIQNARQKNYLDKLLGVVIEQAPSLLEDIDSDELEQEIQGATEEAAWC